MEQVILNKQGKETGSKINLNDEIFSVSPNDHLIYLDVKQYMANQRQGTAKAKQRSENAHSTRKLGRQKGGGGARPGDRKSPVRIGGGTIFGPVPRDYRFKLNKKIKQAARKAALSMRCQDGQIKIIDTFSLDKPSTKEMIKLLQSLNLHDKKTLILLPQIDINVFLSARNIPNVDVICVNELNTYAIMNANAILMIKETVQEIDKMFNL